MVNGPQRGPNPRAANASEPLPSIAQLSSRLSGDEDEETERIFRRGRTLHRDNARGYAELSQLRGERVGQRVGPVADDPHRSGGGEQQTTGGEFRFEDGTENASVERVLRSGGVGRRRGERRAY